jgi:hypothetical protein
MIEGRKAISARIRGGKHLDANSCDPGNDRPDVNIGASWSYDHTYLSVFNREIEFGLERELSGSRG